MKRLYFLLANAEHACQAVTELTEIGVHTSHMHAMANYEAEVMCVRVATLFQTSEFGRGILLGLAVGGLAGLLGGGLVAMYPPPSLTLGPWVLMICGSFGLILGSILGGTIAKDRLKPEILPYESAILRGAVLLIIDASRSKVKTINEWYSKFVAS